MDNEDLFRKWDQSKWTEDHIAMNGESARLKIFTLREPNDKQIGKRAIFLESFTQEGRWQDNGRIEGTRDKREFHIDAVHPNTSSSTNFKVYLVEMNLCLRFVINYVQKTPQWSDVEQIVFRQFSIQLKNSKMQTKVLDWLHNQDGGPLMELGFEVKPYWPARDIEVRWYRHGFNGGGRYTGNAPPPPIRACPSSQYF